MQKIKYKISKIEIILKIKIFLSLFLSFTPTGASPENLRPYIPEIVSEIKILPVENNQLLKISINGYESAPRPPKKFKNSALVIELYEVPFFKLKSLKTLYTKINLPNEKIDLLKGTAYFLERIEYIPKTRKLEIDIDHLRLRSGEVKIQCTFLIDKKKIKPLPCVEREVVQ